MRKAITIGSYIDENGNKKQIQKDFYGKTKKEIEDKIFAYKKNHMTEIQKMQFDIALEKWIYEHYIFSNHAKSTKDSYIRAYNLYVKNDELTKKKVGDITSFDLNTFYNKNKVPTSQKNKINNLLSNFFQYAMAKGCTSNPAKLIGNKHRKNEAEKIKKIVTWKDEELAKILDFKKTDSRFRHKFLIIILKNTGIRIGEALALRYEDFKIDGDNSHIIIRRQISRTRELERDIKHPTSLTVEIPKSDSSYRKIPIFESVITALREHILWQNNDMKENGYNADGFVFTTNSGYFYDATNINRALNRYYKKNNVPTNSPHTYRRTYATKLAKERIPIQVTKQLMGHSKIEDTLKYYIDVDIDIEKDNIKRALSI